ncbi:MAG TPA: hypothetical protein PLQ76_00895, partial [bacterium]|nr:hypothetical protein [bacterium]
MESNVKVLMDATGCTETEAQNILQEAGGDISKALKLLDAVKKEVMVFQIKFRTAGKKEAGTGYVVVMFDVTNDNVVSADMAFPLSPDQESVLDIRMPPTVFVSTLKNVKNKLSDRHKGTSQSNITLIKSKFSSNFIQGVVGMHNRGQVDSAGQKFAQIISGVLGEDVELTYFARAHSLDSLSSVLGGAAQHAVTPEQQAAQLFGSKEAPAVAVAEEQSSDLPSASPQEPLPRIVLITEPEISPFNGKAVRDLDEGDEIIVKIKDGREAARYFSELLGGAVEDELVPLCVPVIRKNTMSETFAEVYVEFGPGIYGQFYLPPEVKVKTRAEGVEIYNPFQDEESLFAEEKFGRQLLAGIGL